MSVPLLPAWLQVQHALSLRGGWLPGAQFVTSALCVFRYAA
jgi:hypothetical protein